jgi:hypothetical protein
MSDPTTTTASPDAQGIPGTPAPPPSRHEAASTGQQTTLLPPAGAFHDASAAVQYVRRPLCDEAAAWRWIAQPRERDGLGDTSRPRVIRRAKNANQTPKEATR